MCIRINMTSHFEACDCVASSCLWNRGAVLDQEMFFSTVEHHKKSKHTKEEFLKHAEKRAQMLTADL